MKEPIRHAVSKIQVYAEWLHYMDEFDHNDGKYMWARQQFINLCHGVADSYPFTATVDDLTKAKPENIMG